MLLQILIIVVLVLYRFGDKGYFMGASYNASHDSESFVSGVFVGYLIYNSVCFLAILINRGSTSSTVVVSKVLLFIIRIHKVGGFIRILEF